MPDFPIENLKYVVEIMVSFLFLPVFLKATLVRHVHEITGVGTIGAQERGGGGGGVIYQLLIKVLHEGLFEVSVSACRS